jgi:hypothetical protein
MYIVLLCMLLIYGILCRIGYLLSSVLPCVGN